MFGHLTIRQITLGQSEGKKIGTIKFTTVEEIWKKKTHRISLQSHKSRWNRKFNCDGSLWQGSELTNNKKMGRKKRYYFEAEIRLVRFFFSPFFDSLQSKSCNARIWMCAYFLSFYIYCLCGLAIVIFVNSMHDRNRAKCRGHYFTYTLLANLFCDLYKNFIYISISIC